jgi:hypothetical protein
MAVFGDAALFRFRTERRLAGKLYGQRFGVDVAFGDPILGEPEIVSADDTLAFAGVAPSVLRLYPIETHLAEKLHAYTLPRPRPNTRVNDLPDIALLGTMQPLDAERLRLALAQTFEFRSTHAVPSSLPDPPPSRSTPYALSTNPCGAHLRVSHAQDRSRGSDADVLLIGAHYPARQQLAREIKRKVLSPQEWRGNLRERSPFAMDAFAGKRIFLIGGENELAELGGMSFEQITPARFVRAHTAIRMPANAWATRGLPRHRVCGTDATAAGDRGGPIVEGVSCDDRSHQSVSCLRGKSV